MFSKHINLLKTQNYHKKIAVTPFSIKLFEKLFAGLQTHFNSTLTRRPIRRTHRSVQFVKLKCFHNTQNFFDTPKNSWFTDRKLPELSVAVNNAHRTITEAFFFEQNSIFLHNVMGFVWNQGNKHTVFDESLKWENVRHESKTKTDDIAIEHCEY